MGFFELFAVALAWFFALIPSYGLAIILLTVAVRLLLLPLSIKQTKSMREMQRIQPEVKKLQQKYKGNRQKLNEEMMALYKDHGVNPLGGCAPLLLQFPVLIALFYVIRSPLQYMSDSALLTALRERPDEVHQFLGLRLDRTMGGTLESGLVAALPYVLLVLLMGFTTWYQQKQMQGTRGPATDAQAQQMQMLTRIMPLMLMVFAYNFPAGVVIYWLTTNVWTIGQQRLMLQGLPHLSPRPAGEESATEPARGRSRKPAASGPGRKGPGKGSPSAGEKPTAATSSRSPSAGKKKRKR
jgi:YidC/Oxa1 family membrane protein insertase